MPFPETFKRAVQDYFAQIELDQAKEARPTPAPKPVLRGAQELARQSAQPDRLVAVRAAASPLFEAAGSLLDALPALARRQGQLDAARADKLHRQLVSEVASFQSICQDARLRYEDTVIASYALCTALDEFASDALRSQIEELGAPAEAERAASAWMAHSLAVRFHGDAKGGENVFRLIGRALVEPDKHIDLLELFFVILRLGFEGIYRHTSNGRREMDGMQHRIHDQVSTTRRDGPAHLLIHWQQIERSVEASRHATSDHATSLTQPQGSTTP
jgi:type VI secretion system protein ImpK